MSYFGLIPIVYFTIVSIAILSICQGVAVSRNDFINGPWYSNTPVAAIDPGYNTVGRSGASSKGVKHIKHTTNDEGLGKEMVKEDIILKGYGPFYEPALSNGDYINLDDDPPQTKTFTLKLAEDDTASPNNGGESGSGTKNKNKNNKDNQNVNIDMIDDEDFFASGSGSGSGDFDLDHGSLGGGNVFTSTTQRPKIESKIDVSIGEPNLKDGKTNDKEKDAEVDKNNNDSKVDGTVIKKDGDENDDDSVKTPPDIKVEKMVKTGNINETKEVLDTFTSFYDKLMEVKDERKKDNNNNSNNNKNNVGIPIKDVIFSEENKKGNDFYDDDEDDNIKSVKKNPKRSDEGNSFDEQDDLYDIYHDGEYEREFGDDEDYGFEHDYGEVNDDDDLKDDEFDDEEEEDVDAKYDITDVQADGSTGKKWSKWHKVGSAKIRVKSCEVKSQDLNDSSCDEVKVQVKSCHKLKGKHCGKSQDMTSGLPSGDCDAVCNKKKDITAGPKGNPNPMPIPSPATSKVPQSCQYSLYDKKRRKYVFVRWSASQLVTQSKVKRWCKDRDNFIIMTNPTDVCRKYYKNLCKVSQKCRSNKPPKERGDFAEGCWRRLVFGDMLPIGLSNRQTIIYFICQRYSPDTEMGVSFGYKETHFGTLYDTRLRAPVLSLHKMMQVGDETWPESQYLIEYGLVEREKSTLWLFNRHWKGLITMKDLDHCYDEHSCELEKFQILPGDYTRDAGNTMYNPTPLISPLWMTPDPDSRIATLSMTNMVPLFSSLNEEWHTAMKHVRTFAISQCGIPYVSDPNISHIGQLSSHRTNKSALYLASGAIPSTEPTKQTGRDINVPSHLWVAGCCVRKVLTSNEAVADVDDNGEDTDASKQTKITSFSFYIENEPGSHVTFTSVLRLELLLQTFYKVKDTDPEVTLFPGQDSACSNFENNQSGWFQSENNKYNI